MDTRLGFRLERKAIALSAAAGSAVAGVAGAHFGWSAAAGLRPRFWPEYAPAASWLVARTSSGYAEPRALQQAAAQGLSAVVLSLLAAASLIALLAFVTVVLTRFSRRKHELSTRAALGAGPVQQLKEASREVAVPCVWGGAAGILLALAGTALVQLGWPGTLEGEPSARLAFAVTGAVAFGLGAFLVTVAGAWLFALRTALTRVLAVGSRATADLGETRFREVVAGFQVAGCIVLLTAATMVAGANRPAAESKPSARQFMLARLEQSDPSAPVRARAFETLLRRLHTFPGVEAESIASAGAVTGVGATDRIYSECEVCKYRNPPSPFQLLMPLLYSVGPDYFELTARKVLEGREFTSADRSSSERVAIVNRAFALHNFATISPLNRVVRLKDGFGTAHRIIGVVEDASGVGVGAAAGPTPELYLSAFQHPPTQVDVLVRATRADQPTMAGLAFVPWSTVRDQAAAPLRFTSLSIRILAMLCFLLACQGLFTTIQALIESTQAELGVRAALGATAGSVFMLLLGRNARTAAVGAAFGALGAFAAQRLLQAVLPATPLDFRAIGTTVLLLLGITLVSTLWPAWRAARSIV